MAMEDASPSEEHLERDLSDVTPVDPTREARLAARRLDRQDRYVSLLRAARRTRASNGLSTYEIDRLILQGDNELRDYLEKSGGRIEPRRRAGIASDTSTCTIYLDECGQHLLTSKDPFKAFSLAAVIIPDAAYAEFDATWKQWKLVNLGAAEKIIHEPHVRKGRGPFYLDGDRNRRARVIRRLGELIESLEFTAITCVVHRPDYVREHGVSALDPSLPPDPYHMSLGFLLERSLFALERRYGRARARVVAESRGLLEDALLQYEFVRLHLDGTSYLSDSWFREQLRPAIEFVKKSENQSGLQLADLLARPCAEKVLDPSSTPDRWLEFRQKLCAEQETTHSILGIKIVPWDRKYEDLWKS